MYRVDTNTWSSGEYSDKERAEEIFEQYKDIKMGDGVDYDSYVELVSLDEESVLKRVEIEEDIQKFKELGTPEENGMDFQFWAKWKEVTA